jgi:hypothetical protein
VIDVIKGCPFCGAQGLDTSDGSAFPAGREENTYWIARCGNPDCHAEVLGDNEEDAIRKWNRRA